MNHAPVLLAVVLVISLVAADIVVQKVDAPIPTKIFTITETQQGVVITAGADVERTAVFVDGQLFGTKSTLKTGETWEIGELETGLHDIEVRTEATFTYEWQDYEIVQNDEPLRLDYVTYHKDDRELTFALKGADLVSVEALETTEKSVREPLTSYSAILNNAKALACYPTITTGKPVSFSCSVDMYPQNLRLIVTIGVQEQETVMVGEETETVIEEHPAMTAAPETPALNAPPLPPPVPQEPTTLDTPIIMEDTVKTREPGVPVTVFIIFMFVSFMAILFVASHHQYENKVLGVHHPHKKKKQ